MDANLHGALGGLGVGVEAALGDEHNKIFFDASGTMHRARFVEMGVKAGKAIYCEKPTAVETAEAVRLAKLCEDAGLKNGVVELTSRRSGESEELTPDQAVARITEIYASHR